MPRNITALLLFALLVVGCTRGPNEVPEPAYHPHLLKPAAYYPSQGKKIDMDSVAKPVYVPSKGRFVKAGKPIHVPEPSNGRLAGEPVYVPARGKVINMDSVTSPKCISAKITEVQSGWLGGNLLHLLSTINRPRHHHQRRDDAGNGRL